MEFKVYQASFVLNDFHRQATDVIDPTPPTPPTIWKTVSGNPIQILDAVASPMQKCEVSLEPIQDLHGQDAPYPAGGGKNKVDNSTNIKGGYYGGTGQWNTDNSIATTELIPVEPNTVYVSSLFDTSGVYRASCVATLWDDENTCTGQITSASFTTGASTKFVRIRSYASEGSYITGDNFLFQLEKGTSHTDYSPFVNICPITGWTGCEVTRTGVNVWDEEYQLGYWDIENGSYHSANNQLCSKNYIPVKPGTEYRLVGLPSAIYLLFYDSEKGYLSRQSKSSTFTTPANAYFMHINLGSGYGTTYNNDVSVNYPSTDTSYHAYSGTTLSVTFPDTVYGGKYEFVSGNLLAIWKCVEAQTLTWTARTGSMEATISDRKYGSDIYPLSSHYKGDWLTGWASLTDGMIGAVSNYIVIRIKDDAHQASLADWNNYLTAQKTAGTPVQILYELATPIEIQLTPQQINTLVGENNIWGDGTIELTYLGLE